MLADSQQILRRDTVNALNRMSIKGANIIPVTGGMNPVCAINFGSFLVSESMMSAMKDIFSKYGLEILIGKHGFPISITKNYSSTYAI